FHVEFCPDPNRRVPHVRGAKPPKTVLPPGLQNRTGSVSQLTNICRGCLYLPDAFVNQLELLGHARLSVNVFFNCCAPRKPRTANSPATPAIPAAITSDTSSADMARRSPVEIVLL